MMAVDIITEYIYIYIYIYELQLASDYWVRVIHLTGLAASLRPFPLWDTCLYTPISLHTQELEPSSHLPRVFCHVVQHMVFPLA